MLESRGEAHTCNPSAQNAEEGKCKGNTESYRATLGVKKEERREEGRGGEGRQRGREGTTVSLKSHNLRGSEQCSSVRCNLLEQLRIPNKCFSILVIF